MARLRRVESQAHAGLALQAFREPYPPITRLVSPTTTPNCFEKGGPDHEARHKLHGKPDRTQNEVAKLKRFGS